MTDPQPSHSFEAVVTHVVDLDKFWVQPTGNQDDRKKLDAIENALGTNSKTPSKVLNADDYISVKLNDRGWKRARLKQHIQHGLAYIQLIDYGNEEQVPESSVFTLHNEMNTEVLPEQAVFCALAGARPMSKQSSPEVKNYFNGIMMNRGKVQVQAYSIGPSGELLVDIRLPDCLSVRNQLLLHQIAAVSQFVTAPYTKNPGIIDPKIGERNGVIVSSITDITNFWVQLRGAEKSISTMMTAMKSMYSANIHTPAQVINIGMLCTVQLGSDWFRAEIMQVLSTGFIMVQLKDFGNFQQVTPKQIYPLEASLMQQPFYAIHCGLTGIVPAAPTATGSFTKQLITWFERYASDKGSYFVAQFMRKEGDKHLIELFDEPISGETKTSTIDLLLQNNCAKRIPVPPAQIQFQPVPPPMTAQLGQIGQDMIMAQQQMYNSGGYNMTSLSSQSPSQQPLASLQQGMGTQSMTSMGTPQSNQMSGYVPPGMQQSQHMQQQQPQIQQQQPNIQQQSAYLPQTIEPAYNEPSMVQPRVPRSRPSQREAGPDVFEGPYETPRLEFKEEVAVEITNSPTDFVCLLSRYFEDVDQMNANMENVYTPQNAKYAIPPSQAKIGMACVAPYIEDTGVKMYRAQIDRIIRNEATVLFVDYGNIEQVPLQDLKYLLKQFSKVPISHISCAFDGVVPDEGDQWTKVQLEAFAAFFSGTNTNFMARIISDTRDGYNVELYNIDDEIHPISAELERRGVFTVRSRQTTESRSTRGRSRGVASGASGGRAAVSPAPAPAPAPSPRQRNGTPSGENEILKAGYKTPKIKEGGYYDVKVVHVSSPGKFSCQLQEQADRFEKINSSIQQFYDHDEGDCMMESLAPLTQCVVLHNNKWSRAYILNASDYGCQVVLVDTQEMVSADPDCLRSLSPEFAQISVQGIKCTLFGVKSSKATWSADSSRFFSEAVKSNDSLVAMISVEQGGKYEIMLTDSSSGSEVIVNALMCVKNFAKATSKIVTNAMQECEASADDFSMYPVKNGDSFNVKPSYVVSQDEFYLHPETAGSQIEELQDSIYNYYESPQASNDKLSPRVDTYCAASWDDGWYRAKIVSLENGVAQVLFIDYGNTDEVMVSDLRGLNKKFKKFPKYAINCRLEGCDDPDTKVQFKKIFVTLVDEDRALHAMFLTRQKEQYRVTLYDGTTPILQQMYKQLYSGGAIGGPTAGLAVSGGPPAASLRDKDLVGLCYAESPVMVYIQGSAAEQSLEVLSRDLSNFYSRNQRPVQQPMMGGVCAVQYAEDQQWYRGRIIGVMRDRCQVQFIDYGNQEDKRTGEIFELDQQFMSLPAQAVPCSLYGVKKPYGGWAEAQDELLQLDNRTFTVKIEEDGDVPQVELFLSEDGRSLAQELINSGFAMDSTRLTIPSNQVPGIGGSFTVKVCHGDNPGRIYIQNMETSKQLEDVMESIQAQYANGSQQKLTEQPKIGNVCCTKYAEDGSWYRATIYGITRDNVKVQFADFGNCEDKQSRELYILQDDFCTLTAQAIECSLHGVNIPSNKWTADMQDKFETAVHERVYQCTILGRKDNAYTVEMIDTQTKQNLADTISGGGGGAPQAASQQAPTGFVHPSRGGCEMMTAPPAAAAAPPARPEKVNVTWPPRIDKFNHVEAVVSWGTGPDDFYVNLIDRDGSLDQLQERMQTVYGSGGARPQRVNRWWYYAVKNPSDNQVYRGKVVDQDRENPMINFIDYGNEESVPVGNLYELEPYLAEIVGAQAVRCTLDGLDRLMEDGNIREEINTKFEALVTESSVMIKNIIPQAKEKPKNDIEVLVKGQSCIDLLEKELAALSGPPDVAPCTAEVGTVIKCAIVNAASPSDFWCQMSGPILRLHEKMKQCTTKLGGLPEVNTYCAAVLNDGDDTVYRAKVLSISDGKITIRCIDYGTEQTLPLQKLFKLKADCADVCAQAFHVSLPLSILEDKAAEALTKLQSIATNAVNIKLYSCTDELFTVEISEQPHTTFVSEGIATSTLASLEEICTSLKFPVATAEQGYFISHIDDLATFYVQQSDLDIDTLTATVHTACTTGSLPALKQPTRGSACAAKYSADGAWYRALVTNIKPDKKVEIRFIDFGNSETVSNTTLKELPLTLQEMPVAALQCCLSPLPEAYSELTELFTTVAMEKEVTLEATESGVSVTMEGSLLADVFEKATSYAKLRFTEATLGEAHNVTCPTVESPYSIWVQLGEHSESLTAIMASLAEYCPEAPALLTCGVDTVCAALFQDDEQWYRAVVLEQTSTDCNVRFIDYGNTSRVTKDKMKLLTEEHLVLPATCLNVRLGDVRPATGEQWSDPAIDKLYELTAEVECEMKLTSYRAQQHVSLFVEGVDLATHLGTAECGARHVPDPEILTVPALDLEDVEVNVVITHVDSVDKVIVQLEDASEAVLELSAATKAAAADLVTVGDLFLPLQCWAKFSADGELYRANVDSFNKTHAEVTFIDYGNADKVPITDLWYFTPQHVTSAVQGIPVKFEGIKPVKGDSWDATATKKLTELVMDQLGTVTFPATQGIVLGSDSLSISMTIEEKDVATQMKEARVARSAVQPPFVAEYPVQTLTEPTLAAVLEVGAKITLALDAGLEELSAQLQDTCVEGHPDYVPETIEEGSVCCCKFSDDGLWYRGLVKALNGDKATVLFVDYGNSEDKKVAELQLLPAEFSTAPYCFAVSLSNQSDLSELEMNFLSNILTDAEVTVTPTGPGSAKLTKTEEGGEPTDVVELTAEYCKAVGVYPVCEPLDVDEVVYLTEVVSPAEWYVQRDGSEESLEAITTALATSSKTVVPAPFVNQPVLGVFDSALYRALVTAVAPGKISLWFVDYGNTATVREVYEVTPGDMLWIPQAIRCSFKNAVSVSGDVFPVTAKKAVETLMLEKEILISSVYEEGCVSVIVEEQNVRMSLLSTGVLKDTAETVGQYTFIPLPEHEVEVFVSHTEQDNLFFANRTGGEKEEAEDEAEGEAEEDSDVVIDAEEYVADYQAVLEDALPPALEEVEVGSLCVVRWEEALYRATVLWLDEAHAKVRFVDYGNTWICPVTSLLVCPEPYRGPGLAVPLHGLFNNKPVSGETLYNVLPAGAKEGLVQPVTLAMPPPKLLKFKYRKMDIGVEETLYVSVQCEHGLFYCQRGEDEETLVTLTEQTAALAATPTKPEHIVPGAPVLAQCVDQAWYRGVVLEPVGAGAKVWFVDYGNSETCSKLCAVTREIMQLPAIAIKCQLKDVTFVNVDALETYNTHVIDNAELTITAHSKDEAHLHTVTALNADGLDVSTAVLELKALERTVSLRSLPVNAAIPLYCSKFISPSEVCFQCEEDTVLLDTIGAECLACPKVTLVSHNVDQLCLALYSVDKAYYRARILSVEETSCKVFFIDYGNKETVVHAALYDIPQSLANHAVCGIPAAFHNSVPTAESGWSDSTIKTLAALMSPDAALTVTATEHRVEGVYPVRVSLGAVDLRQKFEGECCEEEAGLTLGRPWYPLAEPLAMFVSVSVSPTEFYCQRANDEGALAALQALVDLTELTPLKTVNVGDYCVGMSLESEGLFRGEVLAVEEAVATVKFIDYGNTEDIATDTLYAMSPALYTLPVYAVHCALEGEYDDTLCTKFVEEVCYADAEVSITPLSYSDEVCSVSLSVGGVDVKELLA